MPDIVITDVLMSKMDGYELCRKIKTDVLLSHIPVVILTAKVTDQDKITGYQEGADVYMTKPFNPTLLQTVVGNLLTSRSKLREMLLSAPKSPAANPKEAEKSGFRPPTAHSWTNSANTSMPIFRTARSVLVPSVRKCV